MPIVIENDRFKMSPKQYREIVQKLELSEIKLDEVRARCMKAFDVDLPELYIDFKLKGSVDHIGESEYVYILQYKIIGKSKKIRRQVFNIFLSYAVLYHLEPDESIPEDFHEVHVNVGLPKIVWPFVREKVASLAQDFGYKTITIPSLMVKY